MSDQFKAGEASGRLDVMEDRLDHISNRLDSHVSACTTRFGVLLTAILVAAGILAYLKG